MREIKFRAWDFENEVMISGDHLAFEEYAPLTDLLSRKGIMQYTGLKDKNGTEIYEGDIIQYRNFGTQGHHWQWTRDENGKEKLGGEIKYEGYLTKGIVKYSEGSFRIDVCHLHEIFSRDGKLFEYRERVHGMTSKTETTYGGFEVIGNIYENKELINHD